MIGVVTWFWRLHTYLKSYSITPGLEMRSYLFKWHVKVFEEISSMVEIKSCHFQCFVPSIKLGPALNRYISFLEMLSVVSNEVINMCATRFSSILLGIPHSIECWTRNTQHRAIMVSKSLMFHMQFASIHDLMSRFYEIWCTCTYDIVNNKYRPKFFCLMFIYKRDKWTSASSLSRNFMTKNGTATPPITLR